MALISEDYWKSLTPEERDRTIRQAVDAAVAFGIGGLAGQRLLMPSRQAGKTYLLRSTYEMPPERYNECSGMTNKLPPKEEDMDRQPQVLTVVARPLVTNEITEHRAVDYGKTIYRYTAVMGFELPTALMRLRRVWADDRLMFDVDREEGPTQYPDYRLSVYDGTDREPLRPYGAGPDVAGANKGLLYCLDWHLGLWGNRQPDLRVEYEPTHHLTASEICAIKQAELANAYGAAPDFTGHSARRMLDAAGATYDQMADVYRLPNGVSVTVSELMNADDPTRHLMDLAAHGRQPDNHIYMTPERTGFVDWATLPERCRIDRTFHVDVAAEATFPIPKDPPPRVFDVDDPGDVDPQSLRLVYADTGLEVKDVFRHDLDRGEAWQYVSDEEGNLIREGRGLKMRRITGEFRVEWVE